MKEKGSPPLGLGVRGKVWKWGAQTLRLPGWHQAVLRFCVQIPRLTKFKHAPARIWVHWIQYPEDQPDPEPGDIVECYGVLFSAHVEGVDKAGRLANRGELVILCEGRNGKILETKRPPE